jgi:hypothetical protein
MATDPEAILKRYDRLYEQQQVDRAVWQELAEYILPRKSNITTKRTPGAKQTTRLYDSTAVRANELLAASMQGALTSAAVKWFRLKLRQQELNEDPEVAAWLDACTDRMYLAFTQSNLSSELQEVYLDLGGFGTGCVIEEERNPNSPTFSGFIFHSLPVGTYVIAEDAEGRVDTVLREVVLSARAAVAKWGAARVGERIRQTLEKKPDDLVTIIHAVYPREYTRGRTARNKPVASCYVHKDGKHLIAEGGFDTFPCMVPRWTKTSGEVYGRGPGHTALPDVRTLNRARELTLKAWAKAIDPPMKQRQDGVIGTAKLAPASLNTVVNMDDLAPIEFKARFDVGKIEEEQLRTAIRDVFYNSQLQLPNKTIMTATEVERVYELMQRILGPTLGRLEAELLNPLIERSFDLMLRRGALPEPPPAIYADGEIADIDIEYEGPLSRAQRSSDSQAIERTLQLALPIAQVDPEALDALDLTEVIRYAGQRHGIPPRVVRSEKQIAEIRSARETERQKVVQQEQMRGMAEMAGKTAPLVKALGPQALGLSAETSAA